MLLENIKIDKCGLEILRSNKCCREVLRSKKRLSKKKGCLERVSKFFILFIIIKLEAAGVIKDYFGGILSSNDIYIYI